MSEPTPEPTEPTPEPVEPTEPTPDETPTPNETPEQPDEEPALPEQPEQDAPDPAEKPQGATQEEWEARFKKAGQRFDTYQRALFGIFEGDAHDLIDCPLCLGAARGFIDRNMLGHFPEEQVNLVKQVLGISAPIVYQQLPGFRACVTCGGEGKGRTGSNVPGKDTITCPTCMGAGYEAPTGVRANGGGDLDSAAALSGPTVHGLDMEAPDRDEWDQPRILPDGRENPNYGRSPKYWIQVAPWGDTRGLTAQDAVSA